MAPDCPEDIVHRNTNYKEQYWFTRTQDIQDNPHNIL
jgi:hypothetical protein